MERICIIGCSGTGKTALADNLGKELNLPVYHIDGINYLSNWEKRDKKERDRIIIEKTSLDKWVIDGNYNATLYERLKKSDFVIFLDYSTISHVLGVLKRYIKLKGKERKEIPGCKEKLDKKFLLYVLNFKRKKRIKIIELLNKVDSNKVHIFKSRRKLNKWYKNKFNKEIIVDI